MPQTTGAMIKEFTGKKILIIVENLPSPFDRRVWQEAQALKDQGADVTIICPTGKGCEKTFEVIDGITIHRHGLPLEGSGPLGYMWEYAAALFWETVLSWKIFFTQGFDVIHACNPPDLIFSVALPFKWLGKKFIFDHHNINPELFIAKFKRKGFFYRLVVLFEWLTFRFADVVISTNESYKKIAMERGGKKADDIFVVRSGPSLKRIKFVEPDPSLKKGRAYLVGYVGVMGKQEGLAYLIQACRHLVDKGRSDIHFICVGGGTELECLKSYARQQNVEDHFTFTGRVPDDVMLKALNTADVCVNPDEFNEMNDKSTMNKIMEYMALAKPIVQFELAEGRFSAQEASLYARPNDAMDLAEKIAWLLDHPEERKQRGEYGFVRVKQTLEWEFQKKSLYAAYRKALGLSDATTVAHAAGTMATKKDRPVRAFENINI